MRSSGDEWATLDATAQAALVASGAVSPDELVEAACRRIERVDPALGAVPIRLFEEALAQGRHAASGGRFRGVPFLMKDVGARQAGQPYFAGNRALRDADHRARAGTPLGARFREIGLVTVGKSSTPGRGPCSGGAVERAPARRAGSARRWIPGEVTPWRAVGYGRGA